MLRLQRINFFQLQSNHEGKCQPVQTLDDRYFQIEEYSRA
jgi:hypothetical protein